MNNYDSRRGASFFIYSIVKVQCRKTRPVEAGSLLGLGGGVRIRFPRVFYHMNYPQHERVLPAVLLLQFQQMLLLFSAQGFIEYQDRQGQLGM